MKKIATLIIFSLIASIITMTAASATCTMETIKPGPTEGKDAFVSSYHGNTNFGNYIDLRAKYGVIGNPDIFEESYLEFDLSSIPSNATNLTASLILERYYYGGSGSRDVTVALVNDTWNESTITWNNRATRGFSVDTQSVDIGVAGPVIWDVGWAVNWMTKGFLENNGFNLHSTTSINRFTHTTRFYSSDETVSSKRPQLNISYCN